LGCSPVGRTGRVSKMAAEIKSGPVWRCGCSQSLRRHRLRRVGCCRWTDQEEREKRDGSRWKCALHSVPQTSSSVTRYPSTICKHAGSSSMTINGAPKQRRFDPKSVGFRRAEGSTRGGRPPRLILDQVDARLGMRLSTMSRLAPNTARIFHQGRRPRR
jgi:hypothetical protein